MSECGMCPKCKQTNLIYEKPKHDVGIMEYPFVCKSCGFEGYEVYTVDFYCYADNEGKEIED